MTFLSLVQLADNPTNGSSSSRLRRDGKHIVLLRVINYVLPILLLMSAVAMQGLPGANLYGIAYAARASGTIITVATTGSDTSGCGSTNSPCRTIQYAVNAANLGDTIFVAAGTYTYNASTDVCSGPLGTTGVVCVVNKPVTILGGFAPGNWSTTDPNANVTIIDGESKQRGVAVISTGPVASLRMEGFTIRRGIARGIPARPGDDKIFAFGGGMLAELAPVILRNISFEDNQAIGDNTATPYGGAGSGGGLAIKVVSTLSVLENVTFKNNQALGGTGLERGGYGIGGGLYTHRSVVTGTNIVLLNNLAKGGTSTGIGMTSDGERADAQGGGATFQDGSNVTLRYVSASGNQALGGTATTNPGGAFGGAIHVESNQFPTMFTLLDSDLRNNLAQGASGVNGWLGNGGGIEALNSTVTLNRVKIINNTAQGGNGAAGNTGAAGGGGANFIRLRSDNSTISIINSVFADNLSAMGTTGTVIGGGGGGIWLQGVTADIVHTTLARNRLSSASMQGQGILVMNFGVPTPAVANIAYSIIAEHTGFGSSVAALHVTPGNTVTLNTGLFAGNAKNNNSNNAPAPAGTFNGLLTMLSAASAGFVAPGAPNYDYHLTASSPAKDNASGSTTPLDINGRSRPVGPAPDIGADEYVSLDRFMYVPVIFKQPSLGAPYP